MNRLGFELTERCNNNCIHCSINLPAHDVSARDKELSTSEVKNILKEAVALGCLSIRFTGGEPFLRPDLEDLYVFSRKLGLKVLLYTNATLLNERWVNLLSRIPPLEKIEVTVYGMERVSYEAVTRNPGSFDAAWRGINLLLEKKIRFLIKGVFLPQTKHEVPKLQAWAEEHLGLKEFVPQTLFLNLRSRRESAQNAQIKRLRTSPEEGVRFLARDKTAYIQEMRQFCSSFMRGHGHGLFFCGSGDQTACVDAYGMLQPCLLLRHPDAVYDLRKGSLRDAMENFFPRLRKTKANNSAYLVRCARCFLLGFCEQCPAKSWMENGMMDAPVEYECEIAHAKARLLGLVKPEESAWEVTDGRERIAAFSRKETCEESGCLP